MSAPFLPAFASPSQTGMTLRDYFAAKAIEGTLPGAYLDVDDYARLAYRMADAMLRARGER
jgi:hypothetical protein